MSQAMWVPSLEVMLIAGRAIALVAGFVVLAWAFSRWRRMSIRDTQRVFEQLDLVRADLLIMKEVMTHATSRVERPGVEARSPQVQVGSNGGNARGYEIAVRMARNGAQKEELMRSCGITNHEAELLIKLHRRDTHATPEMIGRQTRQAPAAAPTVAANKAAEASRPTAAPTTSKPAAPRPRMQTSRLVAVG